MGLQPGPGATTMNAPRRRTVILLTTVVLSATIAACSSSGGLGQVPSRAPTPAPSVDQGEPDLTAAPSATPAASASRSGSPAATPAPAATTIVRAYFYLGGELGSDGLVPLLREAPETRAVSTPPINRLLPTPTAGESAQQVITSAVPAGSRLLG